MFNTTNFFMYLNDWWYNLPIEFKYLILTASWMTFIMTLYFMDR